MPCAFFISGLQCGYCFEAGWGVNVNPVNFYVFSGTGNTYLVAERICAVLNAEGTETTLRLIENSAPDEVDTTRTLGLAFPVACFGTYPLVSEFMHRLPRGNGGGVFLVDTLGGNSRNFPGRLRALFLKKGYHLLGAAEIVMPDNIFGKGELTQMQKEKIEVGLEAAGDFARALLATRAVWPTRGVLAPVWDFVNRRAFSSRLLQWIRPKVDVKLCTACGLCARYCPVKNITIEGGCAVIRARCQFCLRCRGLCPSGAIYARFTQPYKVVYWPEVIHARES